MKPNRETWTTPELMIEGLILFVFNWTQPTFVFSCALVVALHEIAYRARLVLWLRRREVTTC